MKYIKLYENFNDFDMTSAIQGFYQGIVTNLVGGYAESNNEEDLKDLLDALKVTNNLDKLDAILDELKISRVQLYRKVKALIGYNINDYLLSVRIQKAKFLLGDDNFSISEIAYKVGFTSQSYFSTVFKSKVFFTPSEYREEKKKNK